MNSSISIKLNILILTIAITTISASVQIDSNNVLRTTNADINFSSDQTFDNLEIGKTYINFTGTPFTLIPTSQTNLTIATYNISEDYKIKFNESSSIPLNQVHYIIGNRQPNSNYSVKIYWNNGTKFQDFYIISNNTGYISYNSTGYEFDRYTVIESTTLTSNKTYPIETIIITIIIGGIAYYFTRIRKVQ